MRKIVTLFLIVVSIAAGAVFGQELSGHLDSTVNYTAGGRDGTDHSWGLEEYANLRLRVRAGEKATFFGALNLIALSGNYLKAATYTAGQNPYFASTPFIYGENFAAAIELERLYVRINGEYIDAEAGLLRLNFGYSQVWGSSDFLNPRNPLTVNARPRGLLGIDASFYPTDSLKLLCFTAGPEDPTEAGGGGFIPGISLEKHWDRASLQVLYAGETPLEGSQWGIHRAGLSVKADLALGLYLDTLYTLNPSKTEGVDGLSVGVGADYSLLGGDLYLLAEYLYNGSASDTALGGSRANHHYLYGTALYRINDFCSLSLSAMLCCDDRSISPFLTLTYELFQGFTVNATARVTVDQKDLHSGDPGELGPEGAGRFILDVGARLRF